MGFNKLFLPEVEDLKQQLKDYGNEAFGKRWRTRDIKADAIIGPNESMDFIKQFLETEYNNDSTLKSTR